MLRNTYVRTTHNVCARIIHKYVYIPYICFDYVLLVLKQNSLTNNQAAKQTKKHKQTNKQTGTYTGTYKKESRCGQVLETTPAKNYQGS